MDNFMDKLSKRFNAEEIMRANAEAEAREMNRAKEQAEDYERMMQELRRLYLKNAEVTEQVQQLIQSGIEQFEEYGRDTEQLQELNDQSRQLARHFGTMKEELRNQIALSQKSVTDQTEAVGGELQQALLHKLDELQAAVDRLANKPAETEESGQGELADIKGALDELRTLSAGLPDHVHRENVKVYRNVQAVIQDVAAQKTREVSDRLDGIDKKSGGDKKTTILAALAAFFSLACLLVQILIRMGVF